MIRLPEIKLDINQAINAEMERQALNSLITTKLKINANELEGYRIFKKSVDARNKASIHFVYTLDVTLKSEKTMLSKSKFKGIVPTPDLSYKSLPLGSEKLKSRPIIIGMGPAGLFAGLMLANNGYNPLILERGEAVETRTLKVEQFWQRGSLDSESNVQFGEGGAGTFSDGKLTTLINDKRCRYILEELVQAGAPEEILYKSKPHIGTDILKEVVKTVRHKIISRGGEVRFNAKVTDFMIFNDKIKGVIVNEKEEIESNLIILAIGHSARDTYEILHHQGINIIPKPFAIGLRIEHPQELINQAQYGDAFNHPALGAADYKLVYHSKNGRSAYTFCMCPGGFVVAAASEEQLLVTNGMSESSRNGHNANAAILVGVKPEDYASDHPLAGVEYQRKWESLAYQLGGANYKAPVQLTGDFLADRPSSKWGRVQATYKPGVTWAELKDCLPIYIIETLKEAIIHFDQRIKGFAHPDSILTGVETRSSAPVRIMRNENYEANVGGLYPIGEGAGYAGGIMSSAVDGVKAAEKIMAKYAPIA